MQKTYTGTKIIAYLAFFQILGIHELLNTPNVQHAFSWLLFITEAAFFGLMFVHFKMLGTGKVRMQHQFHKGAPRLVNITNLVLLVLLIATTGASYLMRYAFLPLLTTSSGILTLTVLLFIRNRRFWKEHQNKPLQA
jgi:phosphatidylserine synthase